MLVKVIQYDLGNLAALQVDHHAHTVLVGFVTQTGDTLDLLVLDQLGNLFQQARLVDLVGQLGENQLLATLALVTLDMTARADVDTTATGAIGLVNTAHTVNDAGGGKIRTRDMLHQAGNVDFRGYVMDVTEFDYKSENQVVYEENGVTIRTIPAIHALDGSVSFILEWNGLKFVYGGDTAPNRWYTEHAKGADLVIHSVTKYIGGHGNAMGGVVSGNREIVGKIEKAQNWFGGLFRPMDAFLVTQGVKTLPLRMRQHCRSAQMVAEFLQSHPAVARARYGGLPAWNRQAEAGSPKAYGGMLGVEWKTDAVHKNLGRHVKLILNATSLGDPVTRIVARDEEKPRGIPRRFTRVSIGLEEPEDLIADFKQAIEKCG